jgi:hypothetical protein
MTVAQFVSDVELMLYQGAISDDNAIEKAQIKMWGTYHLNQLVTTELNEKNKRGELIPNIYIVKETVDVQEEESVAGEDRVFAELESEPLNINKGGGILQVWDDDDNEITKTDIQSLALCKRMRFSKPSPDNVMYSHEGSKIYFPGLKPSDIPFEQAQVWYVPKQDLLTMEETDELLASDLVLPEVVNQVVARGRLQLFGSEKDLENDGEEKQAPVYHQQIKSPQ